MSEKSTKKILFIITKSVWGGAQKYVFDLATNLPKNQFEPIVAGGGKGRMAEKIKLAGLPYFEIKNFQRDLNLLKEIFAFFEILLIFLRTKPDIIHVSSSKAGGVTGVAGFIYSMIRRATMLFRLISPYAQEGETVLLPAYNPLKIFTVHGWAFLEQRPKWQNWLIKFFSKLTCLFYDKIICVSGNDYKVGLKYKIAPAKKMIVIHNGINPTDYNFQERTEKEFTVGTIGESTKNKGHEYLTEVGKYFPNIKFKIISNIPDAAKYLKNFDIFVLPSLKEGLPYTILEAGLAKLPVIATNVGGIPEIIQDEETGLLVPPADPVSLANAIKKLADNPALREKLGANLHRKITQEFTLSKMLSATIAAYEN